MPVGRQQQPLAPQATDRIAVAPAVLLELALARAQPALPSLDARHDPLRVQFERHLPGCLRLGLLAQFVGVGVIVAQLLPGPAEELASAATISDGS